MKKNTNAQKIIASALNSARLAVKNSGAKGKLAVFVLYLYLLKLEVY